MLVARDVREAVHEAGQRAGPLVEVDDEVLAGQGQHPLGDHVVDRDRLDERLAVLGLDRQAVDAAVQHLVEERVELGVEVLAGLLQARLQAVGLEHADLAVEAVEEGDVARLVGDLGAEEDAHVLVGDRAHDRPELGGHALLADEERAQPVHPRHALLRVDALVPVDAVLGEVEVLHRPLLALPQLVELAIGQEVGLAAVGGLLQGGIARRAEVHALGAGRGVLGHAREPSARLAGRPTWHPIGDTEGMDLPTLRGERVLLRPLAEDDLDGLIAILAEPAVARWWGPQAEQPDREELPSGPEARFAIVVDGRPRRLAGLRGEHRPDVPLGRARHLPDHRPRTGRASGVRRCGWPSRTTSSAATTASPSTRRPTTSARSAPTRRSASSPWGACATTSWAPTAPGTTACSWTSWPRSSWPRAPK